MTRFGIAAMVALAAGCSSDDPACEVAWGAVFDDLDRSVLAVDGRSDEDVFLVGGGLGVAGAGALVLHHDGQTWRDLPTGQDASLWWVWTDPAGPDTWMVGEQGLILRHDGAGFEVIPSGTTATLFGVWGSSATDVWIVGGTPGPGAGDDDVILHWDGAELAIDDRIPARAAALFKVWGAGPGQVWVSGEAGTMIRLTGQWPDHTWTSEDLPTVASVLTVHGCSASEVYAAAGQELYRHDGAAWRVEDVPINGFANGVSCGADAVLVVGNAGLKLRRDRPDGAWRDERFEAPFDTDFHGAWVSPGGALWAGGGNFLTPASLIERRIGVVGVSGCPRPGAAIEAP